MINNLRLYYDKKGTSITINLGDSYQKEIRSLMLFINKNFQINEDCKTKINNYYDLYKEEIKDKEWEEKHTQKKKYISPLKIGAKKGQACWKEFTSYKIVVDKKREAEKLHQQQETERLQREAEAEKARLEALAKEEAEKLRQQEEVKAMSIKAQKIEQNKNYNVMHESEEASNYNSFCETSLSYISFIPSEFRQFVCMEHEPAPYFYFAIGAAATACIAVNIINHFTDHYD